MCAPNTEMARMSGRVVQKGATAMSQQDAGAKLFGAMETVDPMSYVPRHTVVGKLRSGATGVVEGILDPAGKKAREDAEAQAAADANEAAAGPKPPPAPDFTDEVLLNARRRQARNLMAGRGRRSTFLTEGLGRVTSLGGEY